MSPGDPVLQVRDLCVSFGAGAAQKNVVRNVNFDLLDQEVLAIVGESGSGKSVTLMSMLGLVPKTSGIKVSGTTMFGGHNLLSLPRSGSVMRDIRGGQIGFVFQEPMSSLNPVLTIGRQILETLEEHTNLTASQALSRAADLLGMVGIGDAAQRLRAYPHEFSGGMRQRIMIAIAVACEPSVIIADEPTTALDVTTQAQILELLTNMVRELGVSLILVTHNLGIVARYASRIEVMYAGQIVESGATEAVFAGPLHPYTSALLQCVPRLGSVNKPKAIPGLPPDPSVLPQGCPFQPRCTKAQAQCVVDPGLRFFPESRRAACHFAGETDNDR